MTCNRVLREKPYALVPRTCADCGLGPCHENKQADAQPIGTAATEMPRYTSHKTVWALQIGDDVVKINTDGSITFSVADVGFAPITVEAETVRRYMPVAGDFYVVYADGHKSFSPRKAFIEGYTRA